MLEKELAFYERNKRDLRQRHPDMFALIKGEELIDVYPDEQAALLAAVERFGLESVLVKQILEHEPVNLAPVLLSSAA